MDRQDSNFEQLLPASEKSKADRPRPLYRPHLESKTSITTTNSVTFSIQSATPQTEKGKHTMTKAHPQQLQNLQPRFRPSDVDLEKSDQPDGMSRNRTVSQLVGPSLLKAQTLINVRSLNSLHKLTPRRSADASTQVFTQKLKDLYSSYNMSTETCGFKNCTEAATAGKCDYKVCCSRGCQRNLCAQHLAASAKVEDVDIQFTDNFESANLEDQGDSSFRNRVCVECEVRANRAFWITIFFVIAIPVIAAMPAIMLYGKE